MALGKIINHFPKRPLIIFITAHKDYAVDAFEIQAYDYILKPYSEERIVSTLKKIEKCSDKKCLNNKITLWKDNKMMVRGITEISYCKANERETLIYIKGVQYNIGCSISEFYKKLPKELFFRSHRSYIINIDRITEIIPWFNNTFMLKLQGEEVDIPVSRNNIIEFKQMIGM